MKRWLLVVFALTALSGCATSWVVDSDVQSFSKLGTVAPGATYRFERLPSQQASDAAQQQLEAMAAPALERAGLRPDNAAPRYSVQIGARVTAALSPWADPWLRGAGWGAWGPGWGAGWGPGWGPGYYRHGYGWYGPMPLADNPWYAREVSVVLRELPSNTVVYETRAHNDGPYPSSDAILPVLFDAALQGFPNPPQGPRRVDIPLTARQP
ncbi:DUF4136 domain-containing protein [Variovorax ginsengisoli]|uniref:DUF4136 domain-containing protein n=1 Tax=Variovorax ginsengisoli TaxID=363844 RepID=A0ABT9S1Z5_9BURK|nr:DUF4136 domain-containing protein [Variovorax ginsengisoli]MDP9898380.1 hypothetical protein [Variovorax ginsengisoli]